MTIVRVTRAQQLDSTYDVGYRTGSGYRIPVLAMIGVMDNYILK